MKSKILILGKGFIGQRLQEGLHARLSGKRITRYTQVLSEIRKYRPQIIINCIGFTGHKNIDDCETNIDKTLTSNVYLPVLLAELAYREKIKLVHISSGCIYNTPNRQKPLDEKNSPNFYDLAYSRSKIYAENALSGLAQRHPILIARIRIPLDNRPHPRNILTKMIRFKKVHNVPNSVTYIPDFVAAIKHLIKVEARGIFHIVNKGPLRFPQLLEEYKKYVPDFTYNVVSLKSLNIDRSHVMLSTKKLEKTGFSMPTIKERLNVCVKKYLQYS